jgi:hypothetical protein
LRKNLLLRHDDWSETRLERETGFEPATSYLEG